MIAFDPSLTAAQYLDLARSDPSLTEDLRVLIGPDFNFGHFPEQLRALLDPQNWRRRPPRIRIVAEWNRRGNIRVSAHALTASDFAGTGSYELFWFKNFKRILYRAQGENKAAVLLIYGHIARYQEVVAEVRSQVEVVHAPRIMPFWEFNIDIFEREPPR